MAVKISTKHLQIDKAQSTIVLVVAAATVVTVFSLVSSKALLSQAAYNQKVLQATHEATEQLKKNTQSASTLVTNYKEVFKGNSPTNILGGNNTDDANAKPPDGDNARIVLDALPTSYDFPALVTSVSSILTGANLTNPAVSGVDQSPELDSTPSATPQPVSVNLSVGGSGSYDDVQKLVKDLERSIRPFDATKFSLGASSNSMQVNLELMTYYQPAKDLTIGTKEIK